MIHESVTRVDGRAVTQVTITRERWLVAYASEVYMMSIMRLLGVDTPAEALLRVEQGVCP